MRRFLDVDPRTLIVTTQRSSGVDLWKLHRQIAQYGASTVGMPPILVEEDPLGRLRIINGVTRATRIARLSPGTSVSVEVMGTVKKPFRNVVTIADFLA